MKEIGSEFWNTPQKKYDKRFFLSGRTALESIVRDIKYTNATDKVLLPSYCCHSMIEPFVRHGFSVRFYDVFYSTEQRGLFAELPPWQTDEVLFYMSYFGFSPVDSLKLEDLREKYRIIIDDRTHSWLRPETVDTSADYSFTSFRKWGAFSGIAEACKYNGSFCVNAEDVRNERYIAMRETAYAQKAYYMENGGEKAEFLKLFGKAESMLEEDYISYRPSYHAIDTFFSMDWETVKRRRRKNAAYILKGLADIKQIILPFRILDDADAPLFVPILIDNGRDKLRKYLIEQAIYCPVHWQKSSFHEQISQRASLLYDTELSLLCDQRYGIEDMERMISLIIDYFS